MNMYAQTKRTQSNSEQIVPDQIKPGQIKRGICHGVFALMLTFVGGLTSPAWSKPVDLSRTPPGLTQAVDPNIVVSFDDSGSMLATAMPDNVADQNHFDTKHYYSVTTNTIYFDPSKTYVPPSKPDGTSFPESTYTNAWRDGLCANWPGTYCYGSANYVDLSEDFSEDFLNITSTSNTANSWSNTQECIPDSVSDSDCGDGSGNGGGFYYNCPYVHNDTNCVKVEVNDASATVKQNFANWYSYYRTRNLMTRTSISRAFATMDDSIRVAWQTINDIPLTTATEIKALSGTTSGSWRHDFFTFLYNVHTAGSTPNRRATLRAGAFFERDLTQNDLDPYWNGLGGNDSADLTCRQNFHMLITDGYWNWSSDPALPNPFQTSQDSFTFGTDQAYPYVLDNGTVEQRIPPAFDTSDSTSRIFWDVEGSEYTSSLANIAFHYWSTDLQPNLNNEVPPYLPDLTTGVTGPANSYTQGDDPLQNSEIYWNPKNDPATWQHVVQFMITLGVAGDRVWPNNYDDLRSNTSTLAWPRPANNAPEGADDTWHAAVNSRGQYFSASDPDKLVSSLVAILQSIASRSGSAVAASMNSGVYSADSVAYIGKYDSATWSGTVKAYDVDLVQTTDPNTGRVIHVDTELGAEIWDAGCLLTGDNCLSGTDTVAAGLPSPTDRSIFTSEAVGEGHGVSFDWTSLSGDEQNALNNVTPADTDGDDLGEERLLWLRGDRSNEGTLLRTRASVMGAVVRSQPAYVSYPDSNFQYEFPDDASGNEAPENASPYSDFVDDHIARTPVLYVGANDGMLHALKAETGEELFAYVPQSVYWRAPGVPGLSTLTDLSDFKYMPSVDNTPIRRDVFINTGTGPAWHTLLVGTLGMGGRGVYALDVTDPENFSADDVLWEFNSTSPGGENLGYTYGQADIARLRNGTWVVLVPGGYFPKDTDDPNHDAPAADNVFSSLFILDAQTGALIQELKTSDAETGSAVRSYGLSTPVLGDYAGDQVDEVAFAGDLMGNLWRFDLTDTNPSNWTIDLVYQGNVANGEPLQPITAKPRLFPDPVTGMFVVVFGTGKYLGEEDRLAVGMPMQAIYGIREQGASTEAGFPSFNYYPVDHDLLVGQDMTLDNGFRYLSDRDVPGENAAGDLIAGWYINLDVRAGERVVERAGAIFSTNQALLTTLIPAGNDPCNPGRQGAQILINATDGGAGNGIESLKDDAPDTGTVVDPRKVVGKDFPPPGQGDDVPTLPPTSDSGSAQPVVLEPGGCRGMTESGLNIGMPCWRRRSWKVLDVLD